MRASRSISVLRRGFSTRPCVHNSYKFVVAGGGAGGIGTAAALKRVFGKDATVAIIEPSQTQYYQPLWTLVGAGAVDFETSVKPMEKVIPKGCNWLQTKVETFHPDINAVMTSDGEKIHYEHLIVALGLELRFDMVEGLPEALHTDGVCSNYSAKTVKDTWKTLQSFEGGNALFTLPITPIKCLGAPQKIMYLADDYFRKSGARDKTSIQFCSALGVIFGVQKYAKELAKICEKRDLNLNFRHNLVKLNANEKTATFDLLDSNGVSTGATNTLEYDMIHVTPPMSAPPALRQSEPLADSKGFLDVHQYTLQHKRYPNVFGLGDCVNTPNGKTAAAVAGQLGVVMNNLYAYINGNSMNAEYDGYTSCPLVTSYGKCILAEFDYNAQPLETMPLNQGKDLLIWPPTIDLVLLLEKIGEPGRNMRYFVKPYSSLTDESKTIRLTFKQKLRYLATPNFKKERYFSYLVKKDILPEIYWTGLMKGSWYGPGTIRKMLHLGFSK